jgi:hypothetical protein
MTKPYSVAFKQKMVQQLTGKNAVSAALLVDEILPHQPMRQLSPGMACIRAMQEQLPRVLSVPFPPRFLCACKPKVMGKVLSTEQPSRGFSVRNVKPFGFNNQ